MPKKSGRSRASALNCRQAFLLRNRDRLRAVYVANILSALRSGDIFGSGLLAGIDGPLRNAIALSRGESAYRDRVPGCAPRLRELKAEFGSADSKDLAFLGRIRNLALHR